MRYDNDQLDGTMKPRRWAESPRSRVAGGFIAVVDGIAVTPVVQATEAAP